MIKNILIGFILILFFISLGGNYYLYNLSENKDKKFLEDFSFLKNKAANCLLEQRRQKLLITDYWQEQISKNDEFVDAQNALIKASNDYIRVIETNIRFIQGNAKINETAKEQIFTESKNKLNITINELQNVAKDHTLYKDEQENKVSDIYLEAGESMNNTTSENKKVENCLN